MTPVLLIAMAGTYLQMLSVVMPAGLAAGPFSAAIVCRDARSGWAMVSEWRDVAGPAFALPSPAAGLCRVLVGASRSTAYLASAELVIGKSNGAVFINDRWLRNVDAPPGGSVTWLSGAGEEGVECTTLPDRTRCWFVPLAGGGVLIALTAPQFQFAIVSEREGGGTPSWRPAGWGRLIRARSPSGKVTAEVIALHDALKHGAGRVREARPEPGLTIMRVSAASFWLAGDINPAAYLELRGDGAATTRLPLSGMGTSGAGVVDVTLPHQDIISGEVRSRGSMVEGATVMLSRLLDMPGPQVKDDERVRERLAEVTTGPAGHFRFESLGAGKYELFVLHPSLGRRSVVVSAPAHARLQLEPRTVIRGKVLRHGIPVTDATVQALPSIEAVTMARNPATLGSSAVRSGPAGRFEVIAPDEGRVTLSVTAGGAASRVDLGDASALPPVVDVGEITLDDPVEVELLVDLPPGCELRAAGPLGVAGLTAIRAEGVSQGRWILRPPHSGRWLLAGVCTGREIALDPALVAVPLARPGPVLLKVRR